MGLGKIKNKSVWIATGGTGGHIFPALAVADELLKRGVRLTISSDGRGMKYVRDYVKKNSLILSLRSSFIWASGVGAKNPLFQTWSLFKIGVSALCLAFRFIFNRPGKIVAFGGYSSVPVLAAGWLFGIPTFLHEQNAAIGRANKFAMPFVKTLMTSFPIGSGVYTGLPVRKEFSALRRVAADESEFRLLVTGGSLGASILDETVPKAVSKLKMESGKLKIFVVHQTRPENVEKLRKEYAAMGVKNNILSFIKDMAGELASASIVISRAGASTVVEMQTVGVPAVLVPLGINPDQIANARAFAKNGGGIVVPQKEFNSEFLAKTLSDLFHHPDRLDRMAAAARVPNNAVDNIIKTIER